ncbi:MAG: hypothetical protein L3J23_09660 [Flavobacteriaceae bacterium]|nr:hypothetical protein [Flavobacteriaceae bacterium]
MKKLFVLSVFVLFALISTTTFAQEEVVAENVTEVQDEIAEVQDKTEVKVSELPDAVAKTLKENYADFTAEKASKVLKQVKAFYLVTLTKGEENLVVLLDSAGKEVK